MSRVYFTTKDAEVELSGRERAYAGCTVTALASATLRGFDQRKRYEPYMPQDCYLRNVKDEHWALSFSMWFGSRADLVLPDGRVLPTWNMALNTAIQMGSDPIRLLTRVHAQCEIHGYVEEGNRDWFASLIDEGRKTNILRADMGWEGVAGLCRNGNGGPVVMSYSVCDGFPDTDTYPGDSETFYELSEEEQWERCLTNLRDNGNCEIKPEGWETAYFGDPWTTFDLEDWIDSQREES